MCYATWLWLSGKLYSRPDNISFWVTGQPIKAIVTAASSCDRQPSDPRNQPETGSIAFTACTGRPCAQALKQLFYYASISSLVLLKLAERYYQR
jgi:hypothetical protein